MDIFRLRSRRAIGLSLVCPMLAATVSAQQIEKPSVSTPTTFAVVIDAATYAKTKEAVQIYKKAVEKDGLGTYVISHDWKNPEEIRTVLQKLYNQSPKLEGAVLVGDIPVPMVRDAQYLTSAFKMDQRRKWEASSVPSDRYYDDFDLKFNFLKQDSVHKNYFYYSLDAASPQYISMDIYTARIKPPVGEGDDPYAMISDFLKKAAAEKAKEQLLNDFFVFTGHGYNSESLNAWAGEQITLREQFPDLFKPGNTVKFLNFRMADAIKTNLLSEIQRDELDMAIFHDHGSDDVQLLSGYPYVSNPQPSIANIRRYLRSKIRAAKDRNDDVEKVKAGFMKSLGVSAAWMEDAFVDSVMLADSLLDASTDIYISDLKQIKPNARFIMVDACLTGSFHLKDYFAGHYPFGKGRNVVTMANSVGVLQDLWPDELIGLLQFGVRTGNWMKHTAYLETHLLGDPTFRFTGRSAGTDLNKAIVLSSSNAATWEALLKHANPDVQALALLKLARIKKAAASPILRNAYFNSPYGSVRMEAFKQLSRIGNADFFAVLKAATGDTYEYVRRSAAGLLGKIGSDELIAPTVSLYITDRHSKRVSGKAKDALAFMDCKKVNSIIPDVVKQHAYVTDGPDVVRDLIKAQDYIAFKLDRDMKVVLDKSKTVKERLFEINTFRNYNYHTLVPDLIGLVLDKNEDPAIRLATTEVLGWFYHSYQKERIIAMCNAVISDPANSVELKNQALKTKNIILDYNLSLGRK